MSGNHNQYQKPGYVDRRQWKYDPMTGEPLIDGWPLYSGLPEPEPYPDDFIDALRYHTAISEQPEPEPVAWWHDMGDVIDLNVSGRGTPLYTTPPQREWQGLTDDERTYIAWESNNGPECVAMTEAKLKEKNN